ncbi:ABC transporter permease [Paenibacillus sp. N1-5-1-14]|uniref:ABC transporter permease n=1 Tax=Paenibacillus radicibacter TaxID=2972488 RepID=UPI002159159A|nr:ABC transporter permease [Paenibacillus radicibacter]MCR8642772.1 ABC transporter permease [Paenibacillus radicibacter]
MNNFKQQAKALIHPLTALAIGLIIGAIAILLIGGSVLDTYGQMWKGAFGSTYFLTNTLTRAVPIIFIGLGLALAFRAGFFNLGAEGQLVLGGVAAALTALYLPGPGWVKLIGALLAGIVSGGLWSAFAGWLDAKFKVNLLITTLLLNYVATLLAGYLVANPFKDTKGSAALAQSAMIDKSTWLPKLMAGSSLHVGFIIAVIATIVLFWMMRSTVFGYEMNMTGSNPFFAMYGGVKSVSMVVTTMFISGGLAGLAGAVEVLGMQYRYLDGALTSPNYAWSGLMAALLAGSNPIGTALAAVLLAALQTGAMGVERNTEVPLEIASVIQAVIVVFVSAKISYAFIKRKKGRNSNGTAA